MEKYIEEIIEIVLDNVSCEHEPLNINRVTYLLENKQEVIKKAAETIQKPKINKEFIGKVVARIYCDRKSPKAIKTHIREAFEMAGFRVA